MCTSVTARTLEGALEELQAAAAGFADVVELRLDFLEQFQPERDLPILLKAARMPAIVTYRPTWEGGQYSGDEAERLRTLQLAAKLGAAYVDVELAAAERKPELPPGAGLILSSHNYERTPPLAELQALHARAVAAGADVVKIATTATDITDVATIGALLETVSEPTIALAMKEPGQA